MSCFGLDFLGTMRLIPALFLAINSNNRPLHKTVPLDAPDKELLNPMIKKKKSVPISLVLCALFALLNACSENKEQEAPSAPKNAIQSQADQRADGQDPAPATDGGKCADLLTAKCTECHSTARACEKLGKKSKARWQRTVERMVARGAKINAEEAAALLVCLDNGKDLQSTCR